MTDQFIENSFIQNLYKLEAGKTFEEQFSKVCIESFLFYIIASAIWILEKLFFTHEQEVKQILEKQEVHTAKWYAEKVKAFLYGVELLPETDIYEPGDYETKQIISHVAVTEVGNEVRIKVAKTDNGLVTRISEDEREELIKYVNKIKDAGVRCRITSQNADKLKLQLNVYVDPTIFNSEGYGKNGKPVEIMISDYLKRLPFNGILVLAHLIDEIQTIEGVEYAHVVSASAKYGQVETFLKLGKDNNPENKFYKEIYQPDSGYIELESFKDIKYIFSKT